MPDTERGEREQWEREQERGREKWEREQEREREQDRDRAREPRTRTINGEWGVSIVLVLVIIGGITTNLMMYKELSERQVLSSAQLQSIQDAQKDVQKDLKALTSGMSDVKVFTSTTTVELTTLRREVLELRERVSRVEADKR